MSGHSKWATIKRQKAAADAKRGALFTKLANLITVAAREKGGDPTTNFSLRLAIERAKAANMPKANIERAIKRGTGELAGEAIEELYYEGFGPANTQFVIKCLTDNRNRTASTIRHAFTKHGGRLGTVKWNFSQKGAIRIMDEELKSKNLGQDFELELIDAGADDIVKEEEGMTIYTSVEDLQKVKKFLEEKGIKTETAAIEYVPKETIKIEAKEDKEKIDKFIAELEDNPDVADYYTNADF
jgi:YebC/PmpR family DNA-binding regulatory protein